MEEKYLKLQILQSLGERIFYIKESKYSWTVDPHWDEFIITKRFIGDIHIFHELDELNKEEISFETFEEKKSEEEMKSEEEKKSETIVGTSLMGIVELANL